MSVRRYGASTLEKCVDASSGSAVGRISTAMIVTGGSAGEGRMEKKGAERVLERGRNSRPPCACSGQVRREHEKVIYLDIATYVADARKTAAPDRLRFRQRAQQLCVAHRAREARCPARAMQQ